MLWGHTKYMCKRMFLRLATAYPDVNPTQKKSLYLHDRLIRFPGVISM